MFCFEMVVMHVVMMSVGCWQNAVDFRCVLRWFRDLK